MKYNNAHIEIRTHTKNEHRNITPESLKNRSLNNEENPARICSVKNEEAHMGTLKTTKIDENFGNIKNQLSEFSSLKRRARVSKKRGKEKLTMAAIIKFNGKLIYTIVFKYLNCWRVFAKHTRHRTTHGKNKFRKRRNDMKRRNWWKFQASVAFIHFTQAPGTS